MKLIKYIIIVVLPVMFFLLSCKPSEDNVQLTSAAQVPSVISSGAGGIIPPVAVDDPQEAIIAGGSQGGVIIPEVAQGGGVTPGVASDGGFGDQGAPVFLELPPEPEFPEETDHPNPLCRKAVLVNFRFVLDTTTSMRAVFPIIKSNARAFSQNIVSALKFDGTESVTVRFSITKFDDNLNNRASHGSLVNLSTFESAIGSLKISEHNNNKDWPENGLTAVESLITGVNPNSALTVVIFISDNFAHRGGPFFSRDYSLAPIRLLVSNKVTTSPIFLFDATLTSMPTDDPNLGPRQLLPSYAPVPAEQWNVARSQNPEKLIGKGIGFPLSGGALASEIPLFIKDHKIEACL